LFYFFAPCTASLSLKLRSAYSTRFLGMRLPPSEESLFSSGFKAKMERSQIAFPPFPRLSMSLTSSPFRGPFFDLPCDYRPIRVSNTSFALGRIFRFGRVISPLPLAALRCPACCAFPQLPFPCCRHYFYFPLCQVFKQTQLSSHGPVSPQLPNFPH